MLRAATRIVGHATGAGGFGFRARDGPPVACPFPDIADHVEQTIAIGRIGADRRGTGPAVEQEIFVGKGALPVIGEHRAVRCQHIAPGKFGALEPAARGEFPFGLGWEALAGPGGIGFGILIGDVDDWMIERIVDRAVRPKRMPPVCAKGERPPLREVVEIDGPPRRLEQERAWQSHLRRHAGIVCRVGGNFGKSAVACRRNEAGIIAIGNGCFIDPEWIDAHAPHGGFLGIETLRAHGEGAAGEMLHAGRHHVSCSSPQNGSTGLRPVKGASPSRRFTSSRWFSGSEQ